MIIYDYLYNIFSNIISLSDQNVNMPMLGIWINLLLLFASINVESICLGVRIDQVVYKLYIHWHNHLQLGWP